MSEFVNLLVEFTNNYTNCSAHVRTYSGRAMYGKQCVAVVVEDVVPFVAEFAFWLGERSGAGDATEHYLYTLKNARADNMGLSTVMYWPSVECTREEICEGEEDYEDED